MATSSLLAVYNVQSTGSLAGSQSDCYGGILRSVQNNAQREQQESSGSWAKKMNK